MRFLIDAQLPPALADWLRRQGDVAEHVEHIALRNAEDLVILEYAQRNNAILVTKDRDFVRVGTESVVQVLWIRVGNVSNSVLFERLEKGWPRIVTNLARGIRLIECR